MSDTLVYTTTTEQARRRLSTADAMRRITTAPRRMQPQRFGYCTGCGSVEVRLYRVDGTTSGYPLGFGCEVCS